MIFKRVYPLFTTNKVYKVFRVIQGNGVIATPHGVIDSCTPWILDSEMPEIPFPGECYFKKLYRWVVISFNFKS